MILLDISNFTAPATDRLYLNGMENLSMVVNGSFKPRVSNAQGDTAFIGSPQYAVNYDRYGIWDVYVVL